MIDAVKSYLQMASGIFEATAAKAKDVASDIVAQGLESGSRAPEQLSAQMTLIAEDLMEQSKTNRELVIGVVRTEVERAVSRIGFVREEELAAVRAHVDRLEGQLRDALEKVPGVAAMADLAEAAVDEAQAAAESATAELRAAKALAETTAARKLHIDADEPEDTDIPATTTVVRSPAAKKTTAKKTASTAAKKTTAKKAAAVKTESSAEKAESSES